MLKETFFSFTLFPNSADDPLRKKNLRGTCRWRSDSRLGSNLSYVCSQVQVWDTAGQERFRKSMVKHYYHNVHAVVFVYDVTNMASFCNLQTWIEVCVLLPDSRDDPLIWDI